MRGTVRLPIALDRPCDADWASMTPRERGRFCGACDKTVHDLSAMSAEESDATLARGRGELCVRYLHDASGRVLHRGDELGARTVVTMRESLRSRWAAAAGLAMAAIVFEACGGARGPVERMHAAPEPRPEDSMDAGVGTDAPTEGGESTR